MIDKLVANALEWISGALLISLMTITGIDVLGRYLLNRPLAGAFELTEMTLSALVFTALPLVSRSGGHVDVDLLTTRLPASAQRLLQTLMAILCALVLLFLAWRLWHLGAQQLSDGTRSESLHVPYVIFTFTGVVCCIMAAVFSVARELRQ